MTIVNGAPVARRVKTTRASLVPQVPTLMEGEVFPWGVGHRGQAANAAWQLSGLTRCCKQSRLVELTDRARRPSPSTPRDVVSAGIGDRVREKDSNLVLRPKLEDSTAQQGLSDSAVIMLGLAHPIY